MTNRKLEIDWPGKGYSPAIEYFTLAGALPSVEILRVGWGPISVYDTPHSKITATLDQSSRRITEMEVVSDDAVTIFEALLPHRKNPSDQSLLDLDSLTIAISTPLCIKLLINDF